MVYATFPFKRQRQRKLYASTAIDELITKALANNYELVQIEEGTIGHGFCVLLAPDEKHYNFVIREVYINCWTSAHTVRRCRKISAALQKQTGQAGETAM